MAMFGYDAVNRLDSAQSMGFGALGFNLSFTYDAFGNMDCTISRGTLFCPNFNYGSNSNRSTTSGYNYDASGNPGSDGTYTYTYDAEGRLATMNGLNLSFSAVYYADGTEAEGASNNGWTQDYVYDAYDPGGQYVLEPWGNQSGGYNAFELVGLGGRHIALYNENNPRGTYFVHPYALGSDSNWTDWKGATNGEEIYAPWGQKLVPGGYVDRFAGMSHRDQTGFDVTPNRDYSSTLDRWLTPDPYNAGADPSDPQSWNAYVYVRNAGSRH